MSNGKMQYELDVVEVVRMENSLEYKPLTNARMFVEAIGDSVRKLDDNIWSVIYLDAKSNPLGVGFVRDFGRTNDVVVGMRDVLKDAVLSGANGAVILHGHPGYYISPSKEESRMCEIMNSTFALADIRVLDCITLSKMPDGAYYSYAEWGALGLPMLTCETDFWQLDFSSRMDFAGLIGVADKPGANLSLERTMDAPVLGEVGANDDKLFKKKEVAGTVPHRQRKGGPKL